MNTKKKVYSKKQNPNTIFIQIAAYRDPELLKTLADCIKHAKHPENLRFAIAWQHAKEDKWDTLTKYKKDNRFKILDIDYKESKGVCWARSLLNKQYGGEKYTLQLDSHHRFVKDWDVQLIDMLETLREQGHKKPLLTGYIPDFFPDTYSVQTRNTVPWVMIFDRFFPEGIVFVRPESMDDYKERTSPLPSRFVSAHFIFADGKFIKDVPYDPEYYFHGEEIDLAIRSYMNGYDMFHPHKVLVWHEYTRNGKRKHWDDHTEWGTLNNSSYKHYREKYGLVESTDTSLKNKTQRTLREFEYYCGIEFSSRRVHKNTVDKLVAPSVTSEQDFVNGLTHFQKICIDVHKSKLTETDYNIWAVALTDKTGKEIHRQDASEDEIKQMMSTSGEGIQMWRTIYASELVAGWVVWPHSVSKGWTERLTGTFIIE